MSPGLRPKSSEMNLMKPALRADDGGGHLTEPGDRGWAGLAGLAPRWGGTKKDEDGRPVWAPEPLARKAGAALSAHLNS